MLSELTEWGSQERVQAAQHLNCCCACCCVGAAQVILRPAQQGLDVEGWQQEVVDGQSDPVDGFSQHLKEKAAAATEVSSAH
jgi:hypothetical protein